MARSEINHSVDVSESGDDRAFPVEVEVEQTLEYSEVSGEPEVSDTNKKEVEQAFGGRLEALERMLSLISNTSGKERRLVVDGQVAELAGLLIFQDRRFPEIGTLVDALASGEGDGGLISAMKVICDNDKNGKHSSGVSMEKAAESLRLAEDEVVENLKVIKGGSNIPEVLRIIYGRIGCARGKERQYLVEYYSPKLLALYICQGRSVVDVADHLVQLATNDEDGMLGVWRSLSSIRHNSRTFGFQV